MFRPRSIGLLLALATLLVYLPATSYQFINLDDQAYVTDNHMVQNGLTWAGVKWAFCGAHVSNWHPLTWISHMIDCDLFRLNPAGPHLVNILFHALNAALLFALLFRLTGKRAEISVGPDKTLWPCAFIAALFAWHPLHVESVAWISERKDVLSTFFTLLTLLSYTRYAQKHAGTGSQESGIFTGRPDRNYFFALFFFVLALLSKPMPVTLPLVMLLLDYWPLKRFQDGQPPTFKLKLLTVWEKWPFFLLSAASCIVTVMAQRKTVSSLTIVPVDFRLENALTAYAGYLWKMIWPVHLTIFYPLHSPIALPLVAEALVILAGISWITWLERKRSPWLMVGWLWFLVTLVPVIGLVQVGAQAMADRYSYFPLVGIFLAVTFSVLALAGRFSFLKTWLSLAGVLILGACLVLTEKQLSYWKDSESLFARATVVAESDLAHLCLANALLDQNRTSEAMNEFIRALKLNPESDVAYDNIAKLLNDQGKTDLAIRYCQEAVRRKPKSASAHINFGIMLTKLRRFDEATNEFLTATQLNASDPHPQLLMGQLLLQQGRGVEAMSYLSAALQIDPNDGQMLIFVASVLASNENPQVRNGAEALRLAERAVQLTRQQQPAALDVLAMSYAETGKFGEAVLVEQQAIKLAEASGQEDGLELLQKRLKKYEAQQPWRESFKSDTPDPKPEIKK